MVVAGAKVKAGSGDLSASVIMRNVNSPPNKSDEAGDAVAHSTPHTVWWRAAHCRGIIHFITP